MTTASPAVLVTGAQASGKSTTARALARALGAAVLDQDSLTNPLVDVVAGMIGAEDYADRRLAALVRQARYECVHRAAVDCLTVGRPVVLVAPYTSERRSTAAWHAVREKLAAAGGEVTMVWLRIDGAEVVRRLTERAVPRDRTKLADPEAFAAGLDLTPPVGPHLAVDATLDTGSQVAVIRAALGRTG